MTQEQPDARVNPEADDAAEMNELSERNDSTETAENTDLTTASEIIDVNDLVEENEPLGPTFADLGLSPEVLKSLEEIGYERPSGIQAQIIPPILAGHDVIGQAQTGTGKTGAFALPLISNLDLSRKDPQVLVLTPTRELAIQVSEAFQRYAAHVKGFHVMPIYGGSGYDGQLRQLKRGVHVVVGTPGRLCDHLRRGTLDISNLSSLVIDEADEMLRMGFIEEVEWILEHTPAERRVALFSATMPTQIRRIAQKYLKDPKEITIKEKTATVSTIRQRYWMVSGLHKLDALTRILEGEEFEAMIVFVRTRTMTTELAKSLQARGYSAEALNGDVAQNRREEIVEELKNGALDIVVATDVAARGLDVPRISHVVNYDIPEGTEPYIHRIGRTGRAGRSGEAILFVAPRERRMLQSIERATRQTIAPMQLPTREHINDIRVTKFKDRITEALEMEDDNAFYIDMLESYRQEKNIPAIEIAAALAKLLQGDQPFFLEKEERRERVERNDRSDFDRGGSDRFDRGRDRNRDRDDRGPRQDRFRDRNDSPREERLRFEDRGERPERFADRPDRSADRAPIKHEPVTDGDGNLVEFEKYIISVGHEHGVKPGQIVGAIANEASLEGKYIRRIKIGQTETSVELPSGMPDEVAAILSRARVCGQPLNLRQDDGTWSGDQGGGGGFGGGFKKKPFGGGGGGFRDRDRDGGGGGFRDRDGGGFKKKSYGDRDDKGFPKKDFKKRY
ncbi:MAG: DEAD/DEAH box helicase [Sumerlaeia bacterium]